MGPRIPRSLRSQVILAIAAIALLTAASNLTAVVALYESTSANRQLARERVAQLQEAQYLVAGTLQIDRETALMLSAESDDELRRSHNTIIEHLRAQDLRVDRLGRASDDITVLTLYQSNQLFRNTTHILAGLRARALREEAALVLDPSSRRRNPVEQEALRRHFDAELKRQATANVTAAHDLSARLTSEFQEAVDEVAETSLRAGRVAVALLAASLLLSWLVAAFLLKRHVLDRLRRVSESLRGAPPPGAPPRVPVRGDDEIGAMARAVERFLEDRRRLFAANLELEAFSYTVAHDLRAPLRAINGFASILLETQEDKLDEEGKRSLRGIHRNAIRMGDLITDILNLSRVGRAEMSLGPVEMGALIRVAFEEARATAPERRIVLRVHQVPDAVGDPTLIRQVLVNLLNNAVKFTAVRGEAVIEVDGWVEGAQSVYRIRDNGVGFDMQYAHKLFGVFERLHGTHEFEGTGIGLAIVKRIVERHGGRVWAEGKVDEGATFQFTLPADLPAASTSPVG